MRKFIRRNRKEYDTLRVFRYERVYFVCVCERERERERMREMKRVNGITEKVLYSKYHLTF